MKNLYRWIFINDTNCL